MVKPSAFNAAAKARSIASCAGQQTWLADGRRSPLATSVIVFDVD
jgi:hypothetical protein